MDKERELGSCTIFVIGDEKHWSWNEDNAKKLNLQRMKFSRVPTVGEFIRFGTNYYRVVAVTWNDKYGAEAMLEVTPDGLD